MPLYNKTMIKKGFTLIELLVAISIIGILASLVMVSFTASQKQAKDTQRKSDLKQYQTSLETYANINGSLYPAHLTSVSAAETLCGDLSLTTCPEDPKYKVDATYTQYAYLSDTINYVLWAKLENTTKYWIVCSNGKSGENLSVPGSSNCPI